MKKIIIFISLFIGIYFNINAQSVTTNQLNGRLSIQTATNVSDSIWSISGYFAHSTGKFVTSQIAVNERFFVQIGANTYVGRISVVNSVAVNLITFRVICNYPNPPNGVGAIVRLTSNGYPVYVDGISNSLQAGIQNYFATLINTNAVGNFCEQILTKTAHGFKKFTPIYWNGSTWARPTNDTILPTYIVVDSTSANTFKVANCGNYATTLTTGMYWFSGTSPGYTTTPGTVKTALFEVAQGRLILQPLTGFNLAATGGTGITDGDKGDITVSSSGATWTIDNVAVNNAKIATNAVDSTKAANLSPNDLAQTGASTNDVLTWTGAKYAPRASSSVQDTIRILGIGQSNMIGRPDTSVTHGIVTWDSTSNNKVLVFNLEIGRWQVATESNCHGVWGDLYGAVSANNAVWQFAKELQRRTGKVVKYVISARGGRALSYWTGGTYPMTGEGEDSITTHVARSGIASFDVVIWDQGESDIANASYETQFRNFFLRDIRNRSWFSSYKPVIITGMPVTNAKYISFNERLLKLVDLTDPYLNIAQTDSLALVTNDPFSPGDNVHFTGVALQQLGARYFNAFVNTPKAAKGGLFDLAWRDVIVNAKGNTIQLDSIAGRIDVAADKTFYIEKNEPGWVGRFEPYQYLEYTANGDPRIEMRSFVGNDVDAPGDITQNLGSPRLGSIHFRGYKNGAWRRGASIAVFPDSVGSSFVSGMMRFSTGPNINGFFVGDSQFTLSQKGQSSGLGILVPDSDAAWQVDQINKVNYWGGSSRIYSKFKNTILAVQDASEYSFYHNPASNTTRILGSIYRNSTDTNGWFTGTGSPEGAVTASVGSLYTRTDGQAGTTLYVKESGTGNTGWIPCVSQLKGSATLDFPNTSSNGASDLTITVTGAAEGDVVSLGIPNASATTGLFFAWVSATNTVTVRFHNTSGGSTNPVSGTFKVTVTK